MKTNWLGRSLVESPIYYCLVTSEKECHQVLRKLKIPREMWSQWLTSDANVTFYEKSDFKVAVVAIEINTDKDINQVNALLVHEAVHIWQKIKEELGEENPSVEFEAYSIQRIALELMSEYAHRVKPTVVTDKMISKFLKWKLPTDFYPDGGISYKPLEGHIPTGTNLLNYPQAKVMLEEILSE